MKKKSFTLVNRLLAVMIISKHHWKTVLSRQLHNPKSMSPMWRIWRFWKVKSFIVQLYYSKWKWFFERWGWIWRRIILRQVLCRAQNSNQNTWLFSQLEHFEWFPYTLSRTHAVPLTANTRIVYAFQIHYAKVFPPSTLHCTIPTKIPHFDVLGVLMMLMPSTFYMLHRWKEASRDLF